MKVGYRGDMANVLFLCPHGAGKSVVAATYFRAAAARIGLPANVQIGGPEPDEEIMPNVRAALQNQGFSTCWEPRLVTRDDFENADIIVSIGCDIAALDTDKPVVEWDVPLISVDPTASMQALHELAEMLARTIHLAESDSQIETTVSSL